MGRNKDGVRTESRVYNRIHYVFMIILFCSIYILYSLVDIKKHELKFYKRNYTKTDDESYLVWTPTCQIPDIDPCHQSIRKFLHRVKPTVCSRIPPLTYTSMDNASNNFLRIDSAMIGHYIPKGKRISCCYSVITRNSVPPGGTIPPNPDDLYRISKCQEFEHEVLLSPEEEFTLVRCGYFTSTQDRTREEVYVNTHAVIPIKPNVRPKLGARRPNEDDEQFNVLLVGIDSMSRLNFLRTMPRTVTYLRRSGWVNLKGYNKIGDNTLPNLISVLTGISLEQLEERGWQKGVDLFDDCPFIWKDFHNRRYVTVFAEDEPKYAVFNFKKVRGFAYPPTDYYLRPYMLASLNELRSKLKYGMNVCIGPTLTTDVVLRYVTDFATTFRESFYFAFIWLSNFSHSNLNNPTTMDLRFVQFFNELKSTGSLNTSFIVFFSDHGQRFGGIRETIVGWFESRLPFIYLWVPEWFRRRYPVLFQNLVRNSGRLTSPYDLHYTLRFILHRLKNNSLSTYHNVTLDSVKFRNLFSEVSEERTCEDAGIEVRWCTCETYEKLPVWNKIGQAAARYVVSEIQTKLKTARETNEKAKLCADLRIGKFVNARKRIQRNKKKEKHDDYIVVVRTFPGGGLFEATVRHQNRYRYLIELQIMGKVSRINSYGNQSNCVDDLELKLYCYCITTI